MATTKKPITTAAEQERIENRLASENFNADRRLLILYIKEFFERASDEDHPVTIEDIQEFLAKNQIICRKKVNREDTQESHKDNSKKKNKKDYIDRRTIYDAISILKERYRMPIERYHGKERAYVYHKKKSDFELKELKLIADSILSSKLISESKAKLIIEKLKKLCSIYESKELKRSLHYGSRIKNMNESAFENIDKITSAINGNLQIKFKYFTPGFDYNDKKYKNHGHERTVSPWVLIFSNGFYYLRAYVEGTKSFWNFRVDRMEGIKETPVPRVGKTEFGAEDISGYTEKTFGMFTGTSFVIDMEFHIDLLPTVYDRFGKDVQKRMVDDKHFRVTTPITLSPQFYGWIFGLGEKVKIITPFAQEGMKKMLEDVGKLY